jgi:hypothetical protein
MHGDDQLEVRDRDAARGAPIVDDNPARRHRRLAIIAAGTLAGLVVGGLVVLLMDAPRATGSGDNPAVWVFGLPGFLAIAGTVIGWVAAGLPSAEVVDAPVRQRRFRRAGRAAATERGQLPGSEVPPRYASSPRDRHSSS